MLNTEEKSRHEPDVMQRVPGGHDHQKRGPVVSRGRPWMVDGH